MRTAQGRFRWRPPNLWRDEGSARTHMTLRRGVPRGFSALAALFVSGAIRRANRKDLSTLKARLESEPDRWPCLSSVRGLLRIARA